MASALQTFPIKDGKSLFPSPPPPPSPEQYRQDGCNLQGGLTMKFFRATISRRSTKSVSNQIDST